MEAQRMGNIRRDAKALQSLKENKTILWGVVNLLKKDEN